MSDFFCQISFVTLQLSDEKDINSLIMSYIRYGKRYSAEDRRQYWRCSTYMIPSLWTELGIDR